MNDPSKRALCSDRLIGADKGIDFYCGRVVEILVLKDLLVFYPGVIGTIRRKNFGGGNGARPEKVNSSGKAADRPTGMLQRPGGDASDVIGASPQQDERAVIVARRSSFVGERVTQEEEEAAAESSQLVPAFAETTGGCRRNMLEDAESLWLGNFNHLNLR